MKISVVVPFYNEEGNAETLLQEILGVMRPRGEDFEIIAVDDGSKDRTPEILRSVAGTAPELRIITHPKNRGQGPALWTGLEAVRGEIVVTTDGDRQNDFHDVPPMLDLVSRYDAVFGQRVKRNDPVSKLWASRFAFACRRAVLGDHVPDTACALRVMKRECLRALVPFDGFYRFIPFLVKEAGHSFTTYEAHHRPRVAGKSNFSLLRLYFVPVIVDLLFMWWFKKKSLYKTKTSTLHG